MKNILTIDIDTERDEPGQVLIFKEEEQPKDQKEAANQVLMDLGCLCEAAVTLIRVIERMGIKSGPDSLRDCIEHLTNGFADADYNAFMPGERRES